MRNVKYLCLLSVIFLAFSLQGFAQQTPKRSRSSYIKKKSKSDLYPPKIKGDRGPKMPASHGCKSNEGVVFTLDYLIMRAFNENMVFAYQKTNQEIPGSFNNIVVEGKMIRPKRTWRPGFRMGLGWNTPLDLWDIRSEWTYYYNKSVNNVAASPFLAAAVPQNNEEGFVGYWAVPVADSGTVSVGSFSHNMQGVWQLNYNMLNLELGRSLYLSRSLAVRPDFGLQNGWIHQKSSILYTRAGASQDSLVKLHNNFWGIGVRTGMNIQWEWGSGFSLVGAVHGSLLSGRITARRVQSINFQGGQDFLRAYNISNRIQQIVPGLQTVLGIAWGTCLSADTTFLSFSASWESDYWWRVFKFLQPALHNPQAANYRRFNKEEYPFVNSGLHMEGVAIRGRIDF